jgi:hypothetical protein
MRAAVRDRAKWRICRLVAACALTAITCRTARADAPFEEPNVDADIAVSLEEDGAHLWGRASLRITNDTDAHLDAIPLWLYPNRFREPSPGLSDRTIRWIYPSGESAGAIDLGAVSWNGSSLPPGSVSTRPAVVEDPSRGQDVRARIALPAPLPPGETGTLEVEFAVTIPERRGRFGRWRGVISLGGGWFPRPLTDLTGRDPSLPPERLRANVRLDLPAGRGAVVGDRLYDHSERRRVIVAEDLEAEAIPLLVYEKLEVRRRTYPWGEAAYLQEELCARQPEWQDRREDDRGLPNGLPDPSRFDRCARVLDLVAAAVRAARRHAPDLVIPERILVAAIPAWDRLVQLGPGIVLVSDRLWKLVPAEAALEFHDVALVRAIGAAVALENGSGREPPRWRFAAADLVGYTLAQRYLRELDERQESIEELLGFAAFVPTVDNLLYAPQIGRAHV